MDLFETVRTAVTAREAAELYGIAVRHNGMACCPFHDDKTPSMKLDRRYHCFGCGADGDAISFVAQLYHIRPLEAAQKLAQDFGLAYDSKAPPRRYVRQKTEAQRRREEELNGFRVLSAYLHTLEDWERRYSPSVPTENPHPRFVEAITQKSHVEYLLDILISGTAQERQALLEEHRTMISQLEQRRNDPMAEKQSNKERLREITDSIEQGIKDLFHSEKYRKYLSVMSRFHRYSLNNTMLIFLQKPDATLVAGYHKWMDQFERHVKRGEHGITIIAPTPFKKKIEEQKLDPDTKAPLLDQNGQIITEEKEVEIPMFRPVKVFDLSQTDGKPLPQLAAGLTGDAQNYEVFVEALRRSAPVPIAFESMAQDTDGFFSPTDQRIAIRSGMSQVQTVSALVHEITHSKLHNKKIPTEKPQWKLTMVSDGGTRRPYQDGFDSQADAELAAEETQWQYVDENRFVWQLEVEEDAPIKGFVQKDRNTQEVEAESVSYAVCQYYGIQTGDNSFGYIAGWSENKSLPELRSSLETINKTAGELIGDIDRHFKEICKERGLDLSQQGQPEYRVLPNQHSHNELDRSVLQAFNAETPGQVLGTGRTQRCTELAAQLNSGTLTAQEVSAALEAETHKWHCYVIPDLLTWNPTALDELRSTAAQVIGRIDYLGTDGAVGESVEYTDITRLEQDLRAETETGAPMSVTLYRAPDGAVAPHTFLAELDPPIKGLQITDHPGLAQLPQERTPIEFYDSYQEAAARFQALRGQAYNEADTLNPQSGLPYARLTFGIQREDPPSAADLLQVRSGQNYLVDDFTRMEALHTSPEVLEVLGRMREDLGFDRINRHEKDDQGRYLPPEDLPFDQWENPYFPPSPQLDTYPVPDPTAADDALILCGYTGGDLLPLPGALARPLMDQDATIYLIREGQMPELAFDAADLEQHDGLFAISRQEWEQSPQFHQRILDRQACQQEREQAFLHYPADCFAIYQVQRADPDGVRFMGLDWLREHEIPVSRKHYNLIYTAPLPAQGSLDSQLNSLYEQFNLHHPADYHSPSMSVSDIVAVKRDGVVSCHYVDSVGFEPVPDFLPENPLKNAEMALEDDYNMIDGIINNGPREPPVDGQHREQSKKASVVQQLKAQPQREHKKTAPQRGAEKEL